MAYPQHFIDPIRYLLTISPSPIPSKHKFLIKYWFYN
jgi:hypothetical protein